MNIEKIKNFSQDEQKALNYFELIRNEIVKRDKGLDEGIDFIFGRNFASKIDILLNLVIKLQEDKEELMRNQEKIIPILINDKMYFLEQNLFDDIIEDLKSKYISVQKVKDIIDRIDYDIKKTKKIISKNTNICASYRKNDYQIVRLRAMNTKSLDIKNRLQELLEGDN